MTNAEWKTRGKQFEIAEKAEWQGVLSLRVSFEHGLTVFVNPKATHRDGRKVTHPWVL